MKKLITFIIYSLTFVLCNLSIAHSANIGTFSPNIVVDEEVPIKNAQWTKYSVGRILQRPTGTYRWVNVRPRTYHGFSPLRVADLEGLSVGRILLRPAGMTRTYHLVNVRSTYRPLTYHVFFPLRVADPERLVNFTNIKVD